MKGGLFLSPTTRAPILVPALILTYFSFEADHYKEG